MNTDAHDPTSSQLVQELRVLMLPEHTPDAIERRAAWLRVQRRITARPQRHRWLAVRLAVPAAIALAAAIVLTAVLGGDRTLTPSAATAAVLTHAAEQLGKEAPLGTDDVRVVHVRTQQLVTQETSDGTVLGYVLPIRREYRVGADGSWKLTELPDGAPQFANQPARAAYERAFGSIDRVEPKPPVRGGPGSAADGMVGIPARVIRELPTDPDALVSRLRELAGSQPSDVGRDPAGLAVRLLTFGATTPQVRAALATVLADLGSVRLVRDERVGGRPGSTLALPQRESVNEIVLDRDTGEVLATRTVLAHALPWIPGSDAGMVLNATSYTTAIAGDFDHPVAGTPPLPVGGPTPPAVR